MEPKWNPYLERASSFILFRMLRNLKIRVTSQTRFARPQQPIRSLIPLIKSNVGIFHNWAVGRLSSMSSNVALRQASQEPPPCWSLLVRGKVTPTCTM